MVESYWERKRRQREENLDGKRKKEKTKKETTKSKN